MLFERAGRRAACAHSGRCCTRSARVVLHDRSDARSFPRGVVERPSRGHRVSDRVLVTGGAGYIGSHVVDRLLERGQSVTVLDNFSTGNPANLHQHEGSPDLVVQPGDVLDADLVDELISDHDTVYHLAAAVGVTYIVQDPVGTMLTNVRGTENVLASAHRHDARIVVASTSEIYGRSDQIPFREDGDRVLGPTWVHRWSYSTAKAIDEHLAFAYADRGLKVSIVRYFNSYGPRIDQRGYGSVIARFAAQALAGEPLTVHGDGLQTRCFTHVSDTVRGTLLAAEQDQAVGKVFNIGSPHEVTVRDLAERIREGLGSASAIALVPYETYYPRGFQDTRRRVPDVNLAKETLGFEARMPLDEGLAGTLEWCREHFEPNSR